jgi:hypothetical protein
MFCYVSRKKKIGKKHLFPEWLWIAYLKILKERKMSSCSSNRNIRGENFIRIVGFRSSNLSK